MKPNKNRTLLLGSAVAASMLVGGVIGATVLAKSTLTPANAAPLAAASPTPTPKSNETSAHEAAETPAHEAAENNGTVRPGGGGRPNETAAHEAAETAAHEAAEDAKVKAAPAA